MDKTLISLRIPNDLLFKIEEYGKKKYINRTAVINLVLSKGLVILSEEETEEKQV